VTLSAVLDEKMVSLGDVVEVPCRAGSRARGHARTLARLESNNQVLFWCQIGQL